MKKNILLLVLIVFTLVPTQAHANEIASQDIVSSDAGTETSSDIYTYFYGDKKKVAIFLDAPLTYVDNKTVRKLVPEKTKKLFEETVLDVIPFNDSMLAMRTYLEDNRMIMNEYFSQPLNRDDLSKICKELNADYALFIKITNSEPRLSSILFIMTYKTTVTCDARFFDVLAHKYIISKSIVKDGSTTTLAILGFPDFDNAYTEALKKALNELDIDKNKLNVTSLKQK